MMNYIGVCSIDKCGKFVKAKGMCDMHLARLRRNGSIELSTVKRGSISMCIVPYCNSPHKTYGLCEKHYKRLGDNNSPFKPVVVKYCGWKDCNLPHSAKGLCAKHYSQWLIVLEENSLDKRVKFTNFQ